MKKQVKKVGKYHLYKQIKQREDEFCTIFEGRHIESNLQVMIYQIDRQKVDDKQQLKLQFKRKVSQVKSLQSKVLHKCHSISVTDHHYYIVLEQITAQTLEKKLLSHALNQEEVEGLLFSFRTLFEEMKKLKTFHGQGLIQRRNISPKVIKVEKNRVKLQLINLRSFAFMCKIINKSDYASMKMIENQDLVYYPPQAIKYNRFSQKTDCWSFGVILYNSIYGQFPWDLTDLTFDQFVHNVIYNDIEFPQVQGISKQMIHLMYGCLKGDQDLRFCYDDILCHQIFKPQIGTKANISCKQGDSGPCQSISSMKTLNEEQPDGLLFVKKN